METIVLEDLKHRLSCAVPGLHALRLRRAGGGAMKNVRREKRPKQKSMRRDVKRTGLEEQPLGPDVIASVLGKHGGEVLGYSKGGKAATNLHMIEFEGVLEEGKKRGKPAETYTDLGEVWGYTERGQLRTLRDTN